MISATRGHLKGRKAHMRTKEVVPTVRALKLREVGGLPGNSRELRGILGGIISHREAEP